MLGQLDGFHMAARLDVARGVGMMGSDAALRKILVTVSANLSADLPAIDVALQAGDVQRANRLLHAIKGYMPVFGTDTLIEQVATVEKLSKTQVAAEVQAPYQQLRVELQGLLADIHCFLKPGR